MRPTLASRTASSPRLAAIARQMSPTVRPGAPRRSPHPCGMDEVLPTTDGVVHQAEREIAIEIAIVAVHRRPLDSGTSRWMMGAG